MIAIVMNPKYQDNNNIYFDQVNNVEINLLLEKSIQIPIIVTILTNNKSSWNRKPGTVICRLVSKIIVFWDIIQITMWSIIGGPVK